MKMMKKISANIMILMISKDEWGVYVNVLVFIQEENKQNMGNKESISFYNFFRIFIF